MSDGAGASESGSDQDGLRVQPRGAQSKARSRTTKPSLPPRGQSPHGPLPAPLEKHVHWRKQRGETTVGAGTLPRPRGGPTMAARSLPTSAQVSFWFNNKQTVRGHPHRRPGADGQTVSAVGPLLQSPLHSALSLVLCRESGRSSRRSLAPFLALWTETA
ncbi:unnamed protein product [Rangifer tarandus platyrhynchus]|uniref:Uncharacterized protein n=1 Tax=Rangifer tarandus platyrhynchus TaxID=3082113 RepID=A0AC59YNM8_RANTA